MLMHMDGCTLESVLAFRRFVSDSSIRGVWQGWHLQINNILLLLLLPLHIAFTTITIIVIIIVIMDNHLHPTSDAKIYDVIPSTDLYTTPEYTTLYCSYCL